MMMITIMAMMSIIMAMIIRTMIMIVITVSDKTDNTNDKMNWEYLSQ